MADILLADDEKNIRDGLGIELETEGHDVRLARNGEEALAAYAARKPDLCVLDVMMPKMGGYQACTEIRKTDPLTPILFLTARSDEIDKVRGLELGADDYIVKGTGTHEFIARVNAALRRASAHLVKTGVFAAGPFSVDERRLVITAPDGRETPLYPREAKLLRILVSRPGETFTRAELVQRLTGEKFLGASHAIEQLVSSLRTKLGDAADIIGTVKGAGYRYTGGDAR